MSNIIKASAIRYSDDIKTVDFNSKADRLQQEFVDSYINENIILKQIDFDEVSRSISDSEGGFVPGIAGVASYEVTDQQEETDEELEAKRAELSELMQQIEDLKSQAEEIITQANSEAERIVAGARTEMEEEKQKIYSETHDAAYEKGLAEAAEEIADIKSEYERLIEENNENYKKQVEDLEPAFVGLLIEYLKKLTGIYAEDKRDIITYLISDSLRNNVRSGECIIKVSSNDYPEVVNRKESLQDIIGEGNISIVEDKLLESGKCFIETESRVFDCSLDEQLSSLIADIKLLSLKD